MSSPCGTLEMGSNHEKFLRRALVQNLDHGGDRAVAVLRENDALSGLIDRLRSRAEKTAARLRGATRPRSQRAPTLRRRRCSKGNSEPLSSSLLSRDSLPPRWDGTGWHNILGESAEAPRST
jgi:hypothetical protein